MLPHSWDSFERVLMRGESPLAVPPAAAWTDELTRWDEADTRPRRMLPNPGHRVFREGKAEGRLVGGNAGTLLLLAGTPYWPDLEGRILFLEEDEVETPSSWHRMLAHLRSTGAFRGITGLLVGRHRSEVPFTSEDSFEALLEEALKGIDIPVVTGMDFGHTDPLITLPLGILARIDTARPGAEVTLLESAVS